MASLVPTPLQRRIADLKPGDHVCSVYEDPVELLALATEFVKAGLARGCRCVYIAADRTIDEVRDALAAAGVDVEREQERGALRLLTKRDAYLRDGEFSPAAMLEFLRREERQALTDGFSGLWFGGEMTWALGREPGTDRLVEYEVLLDQMAELRRSVVLCQYNEPLFGRHCIHDVIRTHSGGVLRAEAAEAGGNREELYRFLMENTHDAVSLFDVDGRRVYVSPSIRRLLGWMPAKPFEGVHPDDLPAVREAWGRALAGERAVLAYRHAHADGSWRWLESSGSLVRFRGRPHVLAITRDVTEQRRAEDALREREELLRLLTENTAEFIRFFDLAGKLVYSNPAVQRLLAEVPADFAEFPHPEDRDPSLRWFERVLAGNMDFLQWRVLTRDGEWRWMETRGTVVRYRGRPYVLTICHDFTERKRAEDQLRQAEEQARKVLDTIPQQIWSGPTDGTLDYCNYQWRAYTGLGLEELYGDGWQRMLHPGDKGRVLSAWRESVLNGMLYEQEERHRRFDGAYRWFLCRGVPLRDAEGHIERWYGANTDIEDRKRAEEALQ